MVRTRIRQWLGTVGAAVLGVALITLLGGCASVITRLEGGRLAVLTAQALGVRPGYVTTWGRRREPDGTLIWHAYDQGFFGTRYTCVLKRAAALPSCN